MSNLDNLQDFIEKQRRNPDLGPLKRETVDNRGAAEKDKDMLAETTRAMAEDREKARIASDREGMAEAMRDKLKEDEVLPKTPEDTGEVAFMKEGGGGAGDSFSQTSTWFYFVWCQYHHGSHIL